ncbi:MAG: hypothetical protein Q9227_003455 [Pyrenula ochraceoflavens]
MRVKFTGLCVLPPKEARCQHVRSDQCDKFMSAEREVTGSVRSSRADAAEETKSVGHSEDEIVRLTKLKRNEHETRDLIDNSPSAIKAENTQISSARPLKPTSIAAQRPQAKRHFSLPAKRTKPAWLDKRPKRFSDQYDLMQVYKFRELVRVDIRQTLPYLDQKEGPGLGHGTVFGSSGGKP